MTAGDQAPRRRCAGARRTWPNVAVRGSNRPVLGSGVTYRARVVHLGSKRSSGRLGWGLPRRGADCAAAHRRRWVFWGFPALHLPKSSAKRKGGSLRGSPRACGGRSCCAGRPASRMGGGARRSSVARSARGAPRPLTRREDTRSCCERELVVREARDLPAV